MEEKADEARRIYAYRLTRDDLVASAFQTAKLDFPVRAMLTLLIAAAGLVIAGLPQDMDRALWWTITVGLLGSALAAGVVVPTWILRRRAARLPSPTGETCLEDEGSFLVQTADGSRREISPRSITDVLFGPEHVFLQRRSETLVVPLRAFRDQDDMNRFGLDIADRARTARQAEAESVARQA